jgi:hypothetical protein
VFAALVGGVFGVVLVAEPGRASLYSPEEPFAVPVGDDGKAHPLPFDEFKRKLAVLTNAMVVPKLGEKANDDRQKFLDRIDRAEKELEKARAARKKTDPTAVATLAVDYLRVGQSDKALNLLGPLTADRRPSYFVFTTLGHIHAARAEWAEALRYQQEGLLDTKMPAEVKGLSKQQKDWWEKLDAEYLPRYYRIHRDDTEARRGLSPTELDKLNEAEDVLPLFPLTGEGSPQPVRFVNDAGQYQPGTIAAAEKAKLPPDAFAVVQQLLLWFPSDTRLYWLLAELYAGVDDLDSAIVIFDECTWGRKYGNRKVLMDHRNAVRAAIDARPKPTPPEQPPISMKTVLVYFGVVAGIGGLALLRTLVRRRSTRGA